jgi:hypothetical protein
MRIREAADASSAVLNMMRNAIPVAVEWDL